MLGASLCNLDLRGLRSFSAGLCDLSPERGERCPAKSPGRRLKRCRGTRSVKSQKTIGKPWENAVLMGFNGIYPQVMTNIANWTIPPLKQWINPHCFDWAIFSIASLTYPEGTPKNQLQNTSFQYATIVTIHGSSGLGNKTKQNGRTRWVLKYLFGYIAMTIT